MSSEIYNNVKFNMYKLILDLPEQDSDRIAMVFHADRNEVQSLMESFRQTVRTEAERMRAETSIPASTAKRSIVFIGDSITSDRESYMNTIRELYRDQPNVQIVDASISGDKSDDAVMRFYERTLHYEPDVVCILIGTNDLRRNDDVYAAPCVSMQDIEKNLRYMIRLLKSRGVQIILTTISPVINEQLKTRFPDSNWCYEPSEIDALNNMIHDLSVEYQIQLNDMRTTYAAYSPKEILLNDGLHLNALGQRLLLRSTLQCLSKIL
ncbi:MAG: SGNH/GDSL hydrolase family protein [Eubacteriales bacterium]|nr:SGNH/GDSL hydrolase family protein [Eubacteriales bacterium]